MSAREFLLSDFGCLKETDMKFIARIASKPMKVLFTTGQTMKREMVSIKIKDRKGKPQKAYADKITGTVYLANGLSLSSNGVLL